LLLVSVNNLSLINWTSGIPSYL